MQLSQICQQTIEAVEEVVEFISLESKKFTRQDIEYKTSRSLVSYVDKQAESMLFERLSDILPEAGFLAEEGTEKATQNDWLWIIDPLDGTTNFIHQIPVFAVSVGLVQAGNPVVGVVIEINRNECFYAWQGGGAFLNGSPIKTSDTTELAQAVLATGFPYHEAGKTESYVSILTELLKKARGIRRLGSAATDMCYVAAGRFDGFYEYNLSPWDVAGGAVIVREAGGLISDFSGGDNYLFGNELIAAGAIHPTLLEVVKRHFHKT